MCIAVSFVRGLLPRQSTTVYAESYIWRENVRLNRMSLSKDDRVRMSIYLGLLVCLVSAREGKSRSYVKSMVSDKRWERDHWHGRVR